MKINDAHLNKRINAMASSYDFLNSLDEPYLSIWAKLTRMKKHSGVRNIVISEYIYDEYEPKKQY